MSNYPRQPSTCNRLHVLPSAFCLGALALGVVANPVIAKQLENRQAPRTFADTIRTLIISGKSTEALAMLNTPKARKSLPTHELLYLSGRANQELKLNIQALIDYTGVLTLKQSFGNAYINRALVRGALRDFLGAQADLNVALRFQPNNPEAYLNRGVIFASLNRPQDAIRDFNRAIQLKTDYADAYRNRGIANVLLHNYEAACLDWKSGARHGSDEGAAEINKFCSSIPLKSAQ